MAQSHAESNAVMVAILTTFQRLVSYLGASVIRRVNDAGAVGIYLGDVLKQTFSRPFRWTLILQQLEFIGNQSLGIIVLTAFFTGAAFALSIGPFFQNFKAESIMGAATAISLARELAPLMTAFLMIGRAGSSMTAELSTMRVGEQIDAMEAMGVDPISYLVVPRVIGSMVILPLLCGIFVFVGVIAAYVIGRGMFSVDTGIFFEKITWLAESKDVTLGLQKSFIFAFVIGAMSCRFGLRAGGGAKGVGLATTNAVVTCLLAVLACDYVITYIQLVLRPE